MSMSGTTLLLPRTLIFAMIYASISGLLSGYQLGISGGALKSLQSSSFGITSAQVGHISSIYFIGLMVAGPFGGYAIDKYGRRLCILYMDGLLLFGALLLTVAPNYNTILAGRFIVGCASAVSLMAAVSYLTELASVNYHSHAHHHHRGALVLSVQASIALGFLASYLASFALSMTTNGNNSRGWEWRLLFGVGTGFVALVQWIGMKRMPESPQWLAMNGYYARAQLAVLQFSTNPPQHCTGGASEEGATTDAALEAHVLCQLEQAPEYSEGAEATTTTSPMFSQYWRGYNVSLVIRV